MFVLNNLRKTFLLLPIYWNNKIPIPDFNKVIETSQQKTKISIFFFTQKLVKSVRSSVKALYFPNEFVETFTFILQTVRKLESRVSFQRKPIFSRFSYFGESIELSSSNVWSMSYFKITKSGIQFKNTSADFGLQSNRK